MGPLSRNSCGNVELLRRWPDYMWVVEEGLRPPSGSIVLFFLLRGRIQHCERARSVEPC
jgi:hypothetical protein